MKDLKGQGTFKKERLQGSQHAGKRDREMRDAIREEEKEGGRKEKREREGGNGEREKQEGRDEGK